MEEDILLCNTSKVVGMDADIGTDQVRDIYRTRMKEYYGTHNKSGVERTDTSLRGRWSTIQTDCQKFSCCLARVEDMNPSGTNENDRVTFFLSH
jgi:hypothetical protein